jgi:glycosyltransferase involved in cell wall biosynthesis
LTANPCPHVKEVFTVYDFIQERHYSISGGWAEDYVSSKQERIRAASLLICISEATAADLRLFYPEAAGRARVIHLGSEHLTATPPPAGRPRLAQGGRYVLFVGQRHHHKNFVALLEAMCCPRWPAGLDAHVAGPPFSFAENLLIGALRLGERVRHLGRLGDAELRQQYQGTAAFVYPSLLEGFGLPVLEAQANEAPAVLSDIPVFHEVAGADGAVFFDPRLPESLAEAVAAVADAGLRSRLVEAGHANVGRFSWDRCAEQTLAVYEEATKLRANERML